MAKSILSNLNFVPVPKKQLDPLMVRRQTLINRLHDQRELAMNPKFVRTTKMRDGKTKSQKVRASGREMPDGSCVFFIRNIEFEKGKGGIAVESRDDLPEMIDTLVSAIRAGELDHMLMAAPRGKGGRRRRAA
jgi:hypothetical protein